MKFLIALFSAICIFGASHVEASSIIPELSSYSDSGKKFYEVKIFLNSGGDSINAIGGELDFQSDRIDFQKANDGGSIVNFWLKNPQKSAEGKILFSGGMPGGYKGEKGYLFSAVFSPRGVSKDNQISLSVVNLKAYVNDGKGTEKFLPDFKVLLDLEKAIEAEKISDVKPPEVFAPYVTRDPNLYDGKWIVILNAQDKGEGVDHYEVFESAKKYEQAEIENDKSLPWQTVKDSNAHVLLDQNLGSYVYSKAVDKAGNSRIAIVIPATVKDSGQFNYKFWSIAIILFIGALIAILEIVFFRRKKR